MQDNLILMGINAPRQHQSIITKLIYGLTELYVKGKSKLFPYPETMIDESQTSPVPDVMLIDTKIGERIDVFFLQHCSIICPPNIHFLMYNGKS